MWETLDSLSVGVDNDGEDGCRSFCTESKRRVLLDIERHLRTLLFGFLLGRRVDTIAAGKVSKETIQLDMSQGSDLQYLSYDYTLAHTENPPAS